MKQKFNIITSTCVPLPVENVDTDQIIPARFLKATDKEGFGENLFRDWRYDKQGQPVKDFVLNDPRYHDAVILVAGRNFGSGSSREHAAWAIAGYGFRVVISSFFADIHKQNELNNFVLPVQVSESFLQELFESIKEDPKTEVKVNLPEQTVTNLATGHQEHFDINPYKKHCLMEGLDDIDFLVQNQPKTEVWERKRTSAPPPNPSPEGRGEASPSGVGLVGALILSLIICHFSFSPAVAQTGYPITPIPFTLVKVAPGTFWGQRLEASRNVTIPLAFSKCESEGRYKNFDNAYEHLKDPSKVFKVNGVGYSFDDTDPYKTIEGASYILQTYPDKKLRAYVDSVIDIIGRAQEPDGYLYTARTQNPADPHHWAGDRRWVKEEDLSHELYNLGHMVEGAVAHWQATGSRKFLDIARRYADCVVREVGPNPGQACVVPGHQIAEMALARLYLATGEKKYLDEAKFLLDYRGKTTIKNDYSQSHKPVVDQDEAVGHAVRASYMYAGMADVAALTGDSAYIKAIDRIWDNIVSKKLYITGGIGATASGEAFGRNYELPNMSAYCETCAAIGNVYVNYRLFLLHGESKYYDVLERTLYNGLISGVSLDGGGFFYPNPLESMGQHQRQAWFGCACCPSNICRFIPSLPGYVYAVKNKDVYVNLFVASSSTLDVNKKKVGLTQRTDYPWDGETTIVIDKNTVGDFNLKVRIPGWLRNKPVPSDLYRYTDNQRLGFSVTINNITVPLLVGPDGYINIERRWKKGDEVLLHFDMEPRVVRALDRVSADRGMVAIERGPLVYCAEHPDNNFDVFSVLLNQEPSFQLGKGEVAGTPVTTLITDAQSLDFNKQGKLVTKDQTLTLIPYYAWCHRGSGKMRVWLPQDLKATTPAQPATIASESKVSSSMRVPALSSINDRLVPRDENDRSVPYTHWWPKKASTEWLGYEFTQEATVQTCTVWWFDDGPWGGCRVPKSWRILYQDNKGEWQPVSGEDHYPTLKGMPCTVNFTPVKTRALRLEITQPDDYSAGLFEWSVK